MFPHLRSIGEPDEMEEERRLAYVAHHPGPGAALPHPRVEPHALRRHAVQPAEPVPRRDPRRARWRSIEQRRASRGGRTYGSGGYGSGRLRVGGAGVTSNRDRIVERAMRPAGRGPAKHGAEALGLKVGDDVVPRHVRRGRDPASSRAGRQGRGRHPVPRRRREAAAAVLGAAQEGLSRWTCWSSRRPRRRSGPRRTALDPGLPRRAAVRDRLPGPRPRAGRAAAGVRPARRGWPPRPRRRRRRRVRRRRRPPLRRAARPSSSACTSTRRAAGSGVGRALAAAAVRGGPAARLPAAPARHGRVDGGGHRHLRVARVRGDRAPTGTTPSPTPATSPSTSEPNGELARVPRPFDANIDAPVRCRWREPMGVSYLHDRLVPGDRRLPAPDPRLRPARSGVGRSGEAAWLRQGPAPPPGRRASLGARAPALSSAWSACPLRPLAPPSPPCWPPDTTRR